jgi:hypothetical protein
MSDEIELTPPDAFATVASLVALAADPRACGKRLEELRRRQEDIKRSNAEAAQAQADHENGMRTMLAHTAEARDSYRRWAVDAFRYTEELKRLLEEYRRTGHLAALPPDLEAEADRLAAAAESIDFDPLEDGKPYHAPSDLAAAKFDPTLDERSAGDGLRAP